MEHSMNLFSYELNSRIQEIIDGHSYKITPLALKNHLASESRFSEEDIKAAIKLLVADGSLMYTNYFGTTYIEKSIKTPVRLSEHVILKPPEVDIKSHENEVIVNLLPGAAFGMGDHPSTRLAVSGLEYILGENGSKFIHDKSCMLDIGTGSGILAIVALKLGVQKAVGIDIDPCAVHEAKQNAGINGLSHRFLVSEDSIEGVLEKFDFITANLRYPTLIRLFKEILSRSKDGGIIIMSGIKTDEISNIRKTYDEKHFSYIWSEKEKSWASLAFQKRKGRSGIHFIRSFFSAWYK